MESVQKCYRIKGAETFSAWRSRSDLFFLTVILKFSLNFSSYFMSFQLFAAFSCFILWKSKHVFYI